MCRWYLGTGHPVGLVCGSGYGRAVTLFRRDQKPTDYDWVCIAGGALLGGFTAHLWYPGFGPVVDGLNLVQALAGGVVGGLVMEIVYRFFMRRHQIA